MQSTHIFRGNIHYLFFWCRGNPYKIVTNLLSKKDSNQPNQLKPMWCIFLLSTNTQTLKKNKKESDSTKQQLICIHLLYGFFSFLPKWICIHQSNVSGKSAIKSLGWSWIYFSQKKWKKTKNRVEFFFEGKNQNFNRYIIIIWSKILLFRILLLNLLVTICIRDIMIL